jgi:carbamoyltransferase
MMRILGIHDGHSAAACIYEDGRLTAGIQEERLTRVKNWSGVPAKSIETVLGLAGLTMKDIDRVAVNGHHMPYPKDRQEILAEYRSTGSVPMSVKKFLRHTYLRTVYQDKRKRERLAALESAGVPGSRIEFVDHHMAHAAAAYYGLANFDDDMLVLTNDGAGDGLCATVNIGRKGKLERIAAVPESESIGNIYAMVTFIMGMVPLEHEYKLMGMAPYAHESQARPVYEKLRALMAFDKKNPMVWHRVGDCPETYFSYNYLTKLLELKRFDSICAGLQLFTEEMLATWVKNCIAKTGIRKLALSGGVFMNVKANKVIMELPEVQSLFVYPSCGDETNAMGAAYWVYSQTADPKTARPLEGLYLGRAFDDDAVRRALQKTNGYKWEYVADIEAETARLLTEGHVAARYKGRSEFGARALGNRSILADPTKSHVIREINDMIKSRDFWMPFAPSMLPEAAKEYLINKKNVEAPYMILAFDTTEKRTDLPAALHPYDLTARPQVVTKKMNPEYYHLIDEFRSRTGRGVILNTSFNLHGYPIVDSPEDALDVLARSGLKILTLGNYLVRKSF